MLGIKAGAWASNRGQVKFTALALDTTGKAIKGQSVEVRGRLTQVISTRKRMVGGLYAYDNRTDVRDLGVAVQRQHRRARPPAVRCDAAAAGQVELIAQAKDAAGNPAEAATSIWVTKQGELWFAQDNDDRIDVLPEKKFYEPGETAKLQVRMPFRDATALVSVEREGVIDTGREPARQRPDGRAQDRARLGPQRLRQRPRAARTHSRRAVVFVLHVGLEGAARLGAAASATKDGSTRRRPRWSTSPSLRSSSAWRRSRSASPSTRCR